MFRKAPRPRPSAPFLAFQLALGVALLGGAALAGVAFVHRPWPNRLDTLGFSHLAANPSSVVAHDFADIGSLRVLLIGIAVAIVLSIWRDWPRALACAIGPVAAVLLTERIAKPLVGRHLTVLGGDSFPSGTVTAATALMVVAFLASPRLLRPVTAAAGTAVVVAVSVAVVVMRWHYPTDALGGICVGSGAVLLLDAAFHLPGALKSQFAPSRAQHAYARTSRLHASS